MEDFSSGGPGGAYTPPTMSPSLVAVESQQYDPQSQSTSLDQSAYTLDSSGAEDDVYGTAFAPHGSPPPGSDLTSSGVQRIVDHQLEKYNVSVPGHHDASPGAFGAHIGQGSTILESMSPPSLTEMSDVSPAAKGDRERQQAHREGGQAPTKHVDDRLDAAKVMLDEEEEAELFPAGESLLHGGGTKAVTYRDQAFATLFLGNVAIMVALWIIFKLVGVSQTQASHRMLGRDVTMALYASGTIALGFAFLWLAVLKVAAQILIKAAIVVSMVVTLGVAIFSFAQGGILSGLGLLLVLALEGWYANFVWAKAEMAAATISVTVSFTSQYPAVFAVAAASLGMQLLWLMLWSTASYNCMVYFAGGGFGQLLAIYFILMLFWGVQVLKNILHVTIAGSFASWYYRFPHHQEENPTLTALIRACGTSFGSICLGSLLVAIIRAIRSFAQMAHQGAKNRNALLAAIFARLLQCTDHLAQYFNVYAFVQVAVHGHTYYDAAKKASDIAEKNGMDALVNDELVGSVLTMGAAVGGLACGIMPVLVGRGSGALTYSQSWVVLLMGGLLGYTIIMAVMAVVWSSVVTLFVCFAEDPTALYHTKPAEFQRLMTAWRERSGGSLPIGLPGAFPQSMADEDDDIENYAASVGPGPMLQDQSNPQTPEGYGRMKGPMNV